MNSSNVVQLPPPPIDAWGAFFEYFDKEIAEGRETQESVHRIHNQAFSLDWEAHTKKYGCVPPSFSDACDGFQKVMDYIRAEIRREIQSSMVSKTPFWAKKWRGQR